MAAITTKIHGLDSFDQKYEARTVRLSRATSNDLSEVGRILKKDTIKSIRKITGSRREVRYNPRRIVRVSNAGQAPNHDRGTLVRGIRAYVKRKGKNKHSLMFESRAPYALSLEYGTARMAARPYMAPALKKNRKRIVKLMAKGVKSAL